MNCKTGIIASAKIKRPEEVKYSNLQAELKRVNREIYVNFCDGNLSDDLWDEKRHILAQIRES